MDKTQLINKFNGIANVFATFGKASEKFISAEIENGATVLLCDLADMLIEEINQFKNSIGCPVK